jgi:hypothetical protein
MAGYPVHRSANPWHGHRPLRRANIHPSVTIGHSVHNADYELLMAADNSSVARCRIANSVHQMHEASGRILALATPLCFTRSPRTRPGPLVDQMTGWLCRQAASVVDGGQVIRCVARWRAGMLLRCLN